MCSDILLHLHLERDTSTPPPPLDLSISVIGNGSVLIENLLQQGFLILSWAHILVQATIYRRLRIGRDCQYIHDKTHTVH